MARSKQQPFNIFGTGDSFNVFGGDELKPLAPMEQDQGFGGGFDIFGGGPPKPQRNSVTDLARQEQDLQGVARAAGVHNILDSGLSAVSTVADFLSRPNYAIAGAARELQDGGNMGNALERFGEELFRGAPGVQAPAKRETFANVLEHAGFSEGPSIPAPFGWGKISTRGTLGLALDIALDPTTYITFGASKAVKVLGEGGKIKDAISLSKAGREAVQEVAERVRPEKMRLAEFLARGTPVDLPGSPMGPKRWLLKSMDVDALASRYAREEAVAQIAQRAAAGETHLIDQGGIKWFGKTMVPGEAFGRPLTQIKGSIASTLAKTSPGQALLEWGGSTLKKGGEWASQVDKVFNEIGAKARKIPGLQNFVTGRRDLFHRLVRQTAEDIDKFLPAEMDKIHVDTSGLAGEFRDPKMKLSQYIMHHIDNPAVYTADLIPEGYKDVPNYIAATLSEMFDKEVRLGLTQAEHFRMNYFPHMYKNSQEELAAFSEFFKSGKGPFAPSESRFAFGEMRGFATLDEAVAKSRALKEAGKIDFELKPILDARSNWYRRAEAHWGGMTSHEMWNEMKAHYGRSFGEGKAWMDERFLPGIQAMLSHHPELQGAAEQAAKGLPHEIVPEEEKVILSNLKKWVGSPNPDNAWLNKQSPALQAAAVVGKIRNAAGLDEIKDIVEQYGSKIAQTDPQVLRQVHETLDGAIRKYADTLGRDYRFVTKEGPFQGYFMPDAVVREVEALGEHLVNTKEVGKLLKTYDTVNRIFKVGVTLYHPAFHVRNAYSNVLTNFVALGLRGLNPLSYIEAARVFNPLIDGTFRTPWRRYTYDELRDMMVRFGISKDFSQISELTQSGRSTINRFVAGETGPPGVKQINKIASSFGGGIENSARGMLFMKYLQDGHMPEEAATYVKKFLFDYEQLSKTERDVLTRIIPFYRWTKKNLALTSQELIRQPGKYAAMLKGVREGDSGPEADALPYYLRGNLKLKLRKGPGRATFVQGLDMPVTAALNTIFTKDALTTLRQNMGMIAPALKVLPELALKRDFFSGRDLQTRAQVNALGQWLFNSPLKDWAEVTRETDPVTGEVGYKMNGTKAYLLFRSYAHSRFLNEFDKLSTAPADLQAFTLYLATGLQGKEVDLTMDQKKILRNRIRILEDRLIERGVLREAQNTYAPKGVSY